MMCWLATQHLVGEVGHAGTWKFCFSYTTLFVEFDQGTNINASACGLARVIVLTPTTMVAIASRIPMIRHPICGTLSLRCRRGGALHLADGCAILHKF